MYGMATLACFFFGLLKAYNEWPDRAGCRSALYSALASPLWPLLPLATWLTSGEEAHRQRERRKLRDDIARWEAELELIKLRETRDARVSEVRTRIDLYQRGE